METTTLKPNQKFRRRRNIFLGLALTGFLAWLAFLTTQQPMPQTNGVAEQDASEITEYDDEVAEENLVVTALAQLEVRDWDSKDGYARDQFLQSGAWGKWRDCNTREKILGRDLDEIVYDSNGCTVLSGTLQDPYTGQTINFTRGTATSSAVQIDHVIPLSNAWRTGAQKLSKAIRTQFANDDLNLLAVDGPANMQKSDHDASEWLPPNKGFRCEYIARQIAIRLKYLLWVRQVEKTAMEKVLQSCPEQSLPSE